MHHPSILFFIHFPDFVISILVIGHMTTIPRLFCHAQAPLQNNVHPRLCAGPSMHIISMLVLFFIHFSLLFHAPSIHPSFIHFPRFLISILVIGYMTTISPFFCHAQLAFQSNVHPCYVPFHSFYFCAAMFCFLQPRGNTPTTGFLKGRQITREHMRTLVSSRWFAHCS